MDLNEIAHGHAINPIRLRELGLGELIAYPSIDFVPAYLRNSESAGCPAVLSMKIPGFLFPDSALSSAP